MTPRRCIIRPIEDTSALGSTPNLEQLYPRMAKAQATTSTMWGIAALAKRSPQPKDAFALIIHVNSGLEPGCPRLNKEARIRDSAQV